MVPAQLCAFGRNESSQDSADTSQTQAVAKSSVKSGTKGFTGLEGIRLTPSEPWWCAHTCVCVCVCTTQLRILYKSFYKSLIAEGLVGLKLNE